MLSANPGKNSSSWQRHCDSRSSNEWPGLRKWQIPQLDEEWIHLVLFDSGVTIDYIHVSTVCIPEPAAIVLLGLGSFVFLKRRK